MVDADGMGRIRPARGKMRRSRPAGRPRSWTRDNIATRKQQIGSRSGCDRCRASSRPAPFLLSLEPGFSCALEKGVAYRRRRSSTGIQSTRPCSPTSKVIDGRGWRTGHSSRSARFPATTCASPNTPRAARFPRNMPGWPERVKTMHELDRQEHGRSALRLHARHPRRRWRSVSDGACTCSPRAPTRSWE